MGLSTLVDLLATLPLNLQETCTLTYTTVHVGPPHKIIHQYHSNVDLVDFFKRFCLP